MADFMRSLRDTPYGGSAKKPPSSAMKGSRGAGDADLQEAAAPHSSRKLQYKGSHTMTPNRPTQAPSRTTTPCVPPEAALTIQRTPRQGSMGRRHDSGGEDKQQRDQEAREHPHDSYMSPRDSDDGCINLDETTLEGAEGESVQVLVRIRPHNSKELQLGDDSSCLTLLGTRAVTCTVPGRDPRTFAFDNVLFGPQTEVFEVSGMPMVDNCMSGYNSSIFAYGQTGAGKTHTMLGQIDKSKSPSERGLAPRVFEYLFQKIGEEEDAKGRDSLRYSCRCSFLEIYNETITDLLNPSATNLQIREDTHGCFVEYLTETEVLNVDDVLTLMRHGAENRHTGETRLNRESSRSHSVFTCTVEKTSKASNGVTSVICSRLNLIDLAGSERVHGGALGGSHAVGNHFKEAVHINKSLTTLGRVIMELVEAQRSGRLGRHIPYRDSRLTFLLQDSLGGNAKTQIIANVSPSTICAAETLSTLYFVQRAKCIRNKATINLDYRGDTKLLQNEILRLNTEISNLKSGITEPAIQENTDLRIRLDKEERRVKELELKLSSLVTANNQFKRERERLEERMTSTQVKNKELQELAESLSSRVDNQNSDNKKMAAAERSHFERQIAALTEELQASKAMVAELQASADVQSKEAQEAQAALDARIGELQQQIAQLQADHAAEMAAHKQAADAEMQELQERLERVEQERGNSSLEAAQLQEQLEEVEAAKEAAAEMVEDQRQHIGKLKQDLDALREEASTSTSELQATLQSLTHEKALLEQAVERQGAEIGSRGEEASQLQVALEASQAEGRSLEEQLQASQGQVAQLTEELQASLQASQATSASLSEQLESSQATGAQLAEDKARLEGELACSQQAVATLTEELQAAVAKLAKEKGQLAEELADSQASGARLTEELQGSRDEAARLTEERAQLSEELGMTKGQLAAREEQLGALRSQLEGVESQAHSLSQQVASQQKDIEDKQACLEQVEQQLSEARNLVSAREADVANLERAAKETEMQTHVSSKEQQAQIATLQKEIIRSQEEYVVHEYELKGVAKGLEDELEALRKDQAHAHAMLESKDAELAQLQRCLAEQASALEKAQAALAAREKELQDLQASMKEAMAKAQQLHESEQAYIRELQKELNAYKLGRGDMEQQMKNFLITNTRQGRAFTEIRRLIEWATTPPSSARASLGTRNQGSTPMIGGAENGGGGSPATANEAVADTASTHSPTKVSVPMGSAPSPNMGDEEMGCDALYHEEPHSDGGSNNGDAEEQPDVVQREQSQPPPSGHKWHKRGEVAAYSDVDSPLDQAVHAQHI
uniref:Kinesin motor domain-containing protein n=1 Tax=Dunaliella tertiolecta TaxID=3047 RepID=A0A7S3VNH3_DUNTE|mmetsp:Transcript_17420/g.45649  ORF Transcript_17420/g.45649 Transcript_17420/m.45649 type:complete len:1305 (-) Transcript_17420:770-4684(-)